MHSSVQMLSVHLGTGIFSTALNYGLVTFVMLQVSSCRWIDLGCPGMWTDCIVVFYISDTDTKRMVYLFCTIARECNISLSRFTSFTHSDKSYRNINHTCTRRCNGRFQVEVGQFNSDPWSIREGDWHRIFIKPVALPLTTHRSHPLDLISPSSITWLLTDGVLLPVCQLSDYSSHYDNTNDRETSA